MPQVSCRICRKYFYAKPNWLKRGWGKFCSRKCQHEGQKNGKSVTCSICKKDVYRTEKNLKTSKSKKYFCTKSCQTIWRNSIVYTGKNHPNWKGGKSIEYRNRLTNSRIKQFCRACGLNDKRILCVHHIDKNNKNHELQNLTWLCHNCHYLVHHYNIPVNK